MIFMNTPVSWVAGATGYTGRNLVAHLRGLDLPTWAHVRPDSSSRREATDAFMAQGAKVSHVPWEVAQMAEAIARAKPAYVFSLIGTTKARMRQEQGSSYDTVDLGLTTCLLEAIAMAGLSPVFVLLSSQGTSPSAPGAYMKARWQMERAVEGSGLEHMIVRSGLIHGGRQEPRLGETVAAWAAGAGAGLASLVGASRLARQVKPIDGRTLAAGLWSLVHVQGRRGVVEMAEIPRSGGGQIHKTF